MDVHALIAAKLGSYGPLPEAAQRALREIPFTVREVATGTQIVRDGGPPARECSLVLDGVAIRHKTTGDGGRQIVAVEIRGDFLDVAHLFLDVADHNVEALTPMRVANVDRLKLRVLALDHREIGRALWIQALVEASIAREWLTNLGRRDARTRIAHIISEMALRAESVGLSPPDTLNLPWTQEQLGDVTGLTPVHVNRMLRSLEHDGLIAREGRSITILDRAALHAAGDFAPLYLHLAEQGIDPETGDPPRQAAR